MSMSTNNCVNEEVRRALLWQYILPQRSWCQRRDFSRLLQREGDVRGGNSAECRKEKVMSEGLQLTAIKRRWCQRRDFSWLLQREGDVRGGTSADCYKEKVMSEEGLQLTATKRGWCQRRDFSWLLQREGDVRGGTSSIHSISYIPENTFVGRGTSNFSWLSTNLLIIIWCTWFYDK